MTTTASDSQLAPSASTDQTAPLTFAVTAGERTFQYSEATTEATVEAVRTDILRGALPRDSKAAVKTKLGNGKLNIREGTLIECASRYSPLAELYTPVRRHAKTGLGFGILTGVLINFALLGLVISQVNDTLGLAMIALPACFVVSFIMIAAKANIPIIQTPCMLGAVILPAYLGLNGVFPHMVGAAFAGGLLASMPGMTIGAIVGIIRRTNLARASDAPKENAVLRVVIPAFLTVVIWMAYLSIAKAYLPSLLNE
jgi:hypothetical protein